MPKLRQIYSKPTWKTDEVLVQVNPVQNTWYTVADLIGNLNIQVVKSAVLTTGETLEVEFTINGTVLAVGSQVAVAGTSYFNYHGSQAIFFTTSNVMVMNQYGSTQCKTFKMRMRKTTNAGNGNLSGRVAYEGS